MRSCLGGRLANSRAEQVGKHLADGGKAGDKHNGEDDENDPLPFHRERVRIEIRPQIDGARFDHSW